MSLVKQGHISHISYPIPTKLVHKKLQNVPEVLKDGK